MHANTLISASPHEVTSPSSSRHRSDGTREMLHNVDTTLAHELTTLHRLQTFYEQHTFDTQGPYADLFAVLLSSCKHVIDVNVALTRHIRAHEEALHRQQATCDALCGVAAQHTADIAAVNKGRSHAETVAVGTPQNTDDIAPAKEEPTAQKEAHEELHQAGVAAATSFSAASPPQLSPIQSEKRKRSKAVSESMGSSGVEESEAQDVKSTAHDAAWVCQLERRLDCIQQQLTELQESQRVREAAQESSALQTVVDVSSSAVPDAKSQEALKATLDEWKHTVEDAMANRMDNLTRHVADLEKESHVHGRYLRWMGAGTAADAGPVEGQRSSRSSSPNGRAIHRQKPETSTPASPPPAVVQWLHTHLHQAEEEWKGILEEVQEALYTPPKEASSTGEETQVSRQTNTSDTTARTSLARIIKQLLLFSDDTKHAAVLDRVEHHTQQKDEQLRDVVARLEVLEVYAPHRYAVSAAPPVLGVEVEDVSVPHAGVRVKAVYQSYLADRAGLSVGDVIAGVGHQAIHTRAQLYVVLGELTRDYSAQCRVQIEEGYMRHYTAASDGPVDASVLTTLETSLEADNTANLGLDHALRRARAEAVSVPHRTGAGSGLAFRGAGAAASKSAFFYPSSRQHKDLLAQCLPYFELTLHVLRDGRLRDVVLLIPPSDALRSVAQY